MKSLEDLPGTAICATCGKTGIPRRGTGCLGAIGTVLGFLMLIAVLGAIAGPDIIHQNSMFLAIVLFGIIAAQVKQSGACPHCGKRPMLLLSTPEGKHLREDIAFRVCPKCSDRLRLDTSVLKTAAKGAATVGMPCPSCRTALSVDMNTYEVTAA